MAETNIGLNLPNFEIGLNVENKVHRIIFGCNLVDVDQKTF